MVEFPLPGDEERNRLVRLYFEKYVLQPAIEGAGGGRKISVEEMDYGALCTEIAVMAGGMGVHVGTSTRSRCQKSNASILPVQLSCLW